MTLEQCQDQCQRLVAQGRKPRTIILCREDADKYPKRIRHLYGLNVIVADNWPVSTVSDKIFEEKKFNDKRKVVDK